MAPNDVTNRLIIALDVGGYDEAAAMVEKLAADVGWFKIGSVLFTREGPRVCRLVKESGARLFLDLKFHDIPNTVAGAVSSALDLGADMLTLHLSGGEAMLRAAVAARGRSQDTMMVGVTVLTSLALVDFRALFASERPTSETVVALAELARATGLDGVVASARELPVIRERVGSDIKVVTPGIRMVDAAKDDQARVVTPGQAVRDGADYIVVGRPVIAAVDPVEACRKILQDMTP